MLRFPAPADLVCHGEKVVFFQQSKPLLFVPKDDQAVSLRDGEQGAGPGGDDDLSSLFHCNHSEQMFSARRNR